MMFRKKLVELADRLIDTVSTREPDIMIGGSRRPYLLRWFLIPRNRIFNIYLHNFRRSDDDRALHDHPWINCSFLLRGEYLEHTIAAGGIHKLKRLVAGNCRIRLSGKIAHRIELDKGPCWTLFITGPNYRSWGFHCPEQGWIHWRRFVSPNDHGAVGPGCDG